MKDAMQFACAAVVMSAVPALAEGCFGAGTPMFHCTLKGGERTVDICLQGEVVVYRFGPAAGRAELLLARRVEGVDMTPWPGVGRTIWEDLTFHNGVFSYRVHYAIDRMVEEGGATADTGGAVTVSEGEHTLAQLNCDRGSVAVANFYPLYEAKEAAGECWSRETFAWGAC